MKCPLRRSVMKLRIGAAKCPRSNGVALGRLQSLSICFLICKMCIIAIIIIYATGWMC